MATAREVLRMLRPQGGYVQYGDTYEGIQFIEAEPFSKAEYEAAFEQFDTWKAEQEADKIAKRQALLDKLGLTEEEARILLG